MTCLGDIVLFWYSKQTVCVKWETCMSDYFCISNGLGQGGLFSPKLFSVYVDDLSDKLIKSKIGCHIDNLCMNQVMYADNIYLMASIPASLQEIKLLYMHVMILSVQNDLSFSSSKSYLWCISRNRNSYHVLFYLWII